MVILMLNPVNDDETIEKCVECAKKIENNLRSIFQNNEDLYIKHWYSLNKNSSINDLAFIMVLVRESNILYFGKGWQKFRELEVLHYICELYGIQRMEE